MRLNKTEARQEDSILNMHPARTILIATIASSSFLMGCADSEVKTYRVAKEDKPALPAVAAAAASGHAHGSGGALPHVHGKAPAGWEERTPERMRVASFQISGDGGRQAQMAIIPMPGATGIELQSINMWREELGLESFNDEQFKAEAKAIQVGGLSGKLFEIDSKAPRPGEEFKRATLGAVFERGGMLWFAKLTGESTLVAQQKENFQSYLQSLEFHDEAHGSAPAQTAAVERPAETVKAQAEAGGAAGTPETPRWSPPANWKQKAPGPMLTAAYSVEESGSQADVTISQLGGDGGGMAANVSRWRGQLGLAPGSDAEIQSAITMLDVNGKKAYLADIKGKNVRTGKAARMIAIGVPAGSQTWFYKLMGDEMLVGKEKDALVKFINNAH